VPLHLYINIWVVISSRYPVAFKAYILVWICCVRRWYWLFQNTLDVCWSHNSSRKPKHMCTYMHIRQSQWKNNSRTRLLVQPFTTAVKLQTLTLPPSVEQQDVKSNQAVSESWDKGLHTGTAGQTHICSEQPHSEPDTRYADYNRETNIRLTLNLFTSQHFILWFLFSGNNPLLTFKPSNIILLHRYTAEGILPPTHIFTATLHSQCILRVILLL